jgi:hypothetical protein
VRFVSLPQRTIRVRPGARFDVRVDADAPAVAWRLGARRGTGDPRRLVLRAPERAGPYVLRVRVGPHAARATVRVGRR